MTLRGRFRAFVAAWFAGAAGIALAALIVSPWLALLALPFAVASHRHASRRFRCPGCDAPIRTVRQASILPPRPAGIAFPRRCHRCGRGI